MTPQRKASVSSAAPRTYTKRKRQEESSDATGNQESPMEEEAKNEVKNDPDYLPKRHSQRRDADGRRWCDTTLHHCPLALREWLDYKQIICDTCGNEQRKGSTEGFASWCCEAHDQDICFKCIPIDIDLPSDATEITIAETAEKPPESPTRLSGLRRVQGEWQHLVDFEGAQCITRIWTPTTDSEVPCHTCRDACNTSAAGTPKLWRCDGHTRRSTRAPLRLFLMSTTTTTTPNQDKQVLREVRSKLANMLQNPKTAKTATSPGKAKHRKKGRSPLTKSGGTGGSSAPAVGT
jgi:hypothetical protein